MPEPPVVNASPLIILAHGGAFDLLRVAGDQLVVPSAVAVEIRQRGLADPAVQAMDQASWLAIVQDLPIPQAILSWDLGPGESAVLTRALAHPGAEAICDDQAARRCASTLGIPVRGTLALVLGAKQRGMISLARPLLERFRRGGMYLSDDLMNAVLKKVGE